MFMAVKSLMQTLGDVLGAKFAKITELFARKGNVSEGFDTLEKLEVLIRRLNQAVFEGSGENGLDTLAEISVFLTENRERILSIGAGLTGEDIVDSLSSDDSRKVLAASQGKALKASIDSVIVSIGTCLENAKSYTDGQVSSIAQSLASINISLQGKAEATAVYTQAEVGTPEEFRVAFESVCGNDFKS